MNMEPELLCLCLTKCRGTRKCFFFCCCYFTCTKYFVRRILCICVCMCFSSVKVLCHHIYKLLQWQRRRIERDEINERVLWSCRQVQCAKLMPFFSYAEQIILDFVVWIVGVHEIHLTGKCAQVQNVSLMYINLEFSVRFFFRWCLLSHILCVFAFGLSWEPSKVLANTHFLTKFFRVYVFLFHCMGLRWRQQSTHYLAHIFYYSEKHK